MSDKTITQIKYKKTSCYYCNEWLDNDNFKNHLLNCGQMLEKCPNDCTSYVQRKWMNNHLKECPKKVVIGISTHHNSIITNSNKEHAAEDDKTTIEIKSNGDDSLKKKNNGENSLIYQHQDFNDMAQGILILEQDIVAIRSALHEETRQRHRLITDVGSLRKRNQISDEWTLKVGDVLAALKKCLNEETESRCIDLRTCKEDVMKMWYQLQQIEEWRLEMRMRIDHLQSEMIEDDNIRGHLDVLTGDNRISVMKIGDLERELNGLKLQLAEERIAFDTQNNLLTKKMNALEEIIEEQQNQLALMPVNNLKQFNELKSQMQIEQNIKKAEVSVKQEKLDFEIKAMKHIVTETEDKCDKLEKIVINTKNTVYKTKQNLTDLDVHLRHHKKLMGIHNCRGHLIWRIDEYDMKLADAKENGTTIRSPMFCNKQYGYTLRLDVNLDGIGTWKGRNLIACLTVVAGEWDPLLVWPCKLQADIILRDQPNDLNLAKDFCKTIVVKRKHEQYEQNQYIFIPHKTITSCNYLKNDAIFFEVIMHKSS